MIPKRVYLRAKELEEHITCERMVSCDEPFDCCNVEYTAISQLWHDVSDNPDEGKSILVMFKSGYLTSWNVRDFADMPFNFKAFNVERWAYISDLFPKN